MENAAEISAFHGPFSSRAGWQSPLFTEFESLVRFEFEIGIKHVVEEKVAEAV